MIQLRKAVFEDWKSLLEWRIDPETRKNSHDMNEIQEKEHKQWLTGILKDSNRRLFIATWSGDPVGTTRADFDPATGIFEISWTVAPKYRGKGFGKHMVKKLVENLNARVRAEVKKGNTSSIKIAEYAGLYADYEENNIIHLKNY